MAFQSQHQISCKKLTIHIHGTISRVQFRSSNHLQNKSDINFLSFLKFTALYKNQGEAVMTMSAAVIGANARLYPAIIYNTVTERIYRCTVSIKINLNSNT